MEVGRLVSQLQQIPAHQALFLLKNCVSIPKLMYILRTPRVRDKAGLRVFDETVRKAVCSITNVEMTDSVWKQATLPTSIGGLGIRRTEDIALPAFLASLFSVRNLIEQILPSTDVMSCLSPLVDAWKLKSLTEVPEASLQGTQKAWDRPIAEGVFRNITERVGHEKDDSNQARLPALSSKESGGWLQWLPASSLGTLLNDDTLRISVALVWERRFVNPTHVTAESKWTSKVTTD